MLAMRGVPCLITDGPPTTRPSTSISGGSRAVSTSGRPTLADVAALAGVSLKTASRALNEEYGVARTTSERVFAAARELGFRPNRLAQSLAGGGPSAAVGLLIPDVSDPFVAGVVGAVERVLAARDLQLITASHGDDPIASTARQRARRAAGRRAAHHVGARRRLLSPRGHQATGWSSWRWTGPSRGWTWTPSRSTTRPAPARPSGRLLAAGHRRVAALAGDVWLWTLARRLDGYRAAHADAGVAVDEALISIDQGASEAQAALKAMLELDDPPTAVFAAHPGVGRGAMRAMHDSGMAVDLAVFDGIDDNDLLITPPVVVAVSGPDRIGQLAAELLLDRLKGLQGPPRHVVLAPLLLGPNERYVANVGGVTWGGPATRPPEPTSAQASFTTHVPVSASNGRMPGASDRSGTVRTEQIVG